MAGVVLEQRARGHECHDQRLALRQVLHFSRRGNVVVHHVGKFRRVIGNDFRPQTLVDARRQRDDTGQHEIDVAAAGCLHRLQLRGQFRRGRLRESHFRDEVGMLRLIRLDRALCQREVTRDIDDADRDRTLGLRWAPVRRRRTMRRSRATPASGAAGSLRGLASRSFMEAVAFNTSPRAVAATHDSAVHATAGTRCRSSHDCDVATTPDPRFRGMTHP